jgi:hypothetical protein
MKLGEKRIAYLKGYAMAIQDIMYQITGENSCAKSYDPLQVDDTYLHSYAFNLKDGGRHHPISDYNSLEEITDLMLKEGTERINYWIKETTW